MTKQEIHKQGLKIAAFLGGVCSVFVKNNSEGSEASVNTHKETEEQPKQPLMMVPCSELQMGSCWHRSKGRDGVMAKKGCVTLQAFTVHWHSWGFRICNVHVRFNMDLRSGIVSLKWLFHTVCDICLRAPAATPWNWGLGCRRAMSSYSFCT